MRKVTPFLSSVAIMIVLSLLQRLFLVESDIGKQWAVVAVWFGLCNWFLRSPKPSLLAAQQLETAMAPSPRPAGPGDVRDQKAATSAAATRPSSLDPLYMPIQTRRSQTGV
jgi:hypothetical protein